MRLCYRHRLVSQQSKNLPLCYSIPVFEHPSCLLSRSSVPFLRSPVIVPFEPVHHRLSTQTYDLLLLGLILQVGRASTSEGFFEGFKLLGNPLNILETQLGLNDLHISDGVDVALNVNHLGVVERPNDLENTVNSANVG